MSAKCTSRVWETSKQKGSSLLLLLAIADSADDNGVSSPSIIALARKTRLSDRQVKRLIKDLVDEDELRVFKRWKYNVYLIPMWEDSTPDFPHCFICRGPAVKEANVRLVTRDDGNKICTVCMSHMESQISEMPEMSREPSLSSDIQGNIPSSDKLSPDKVTPMSPDDEDSAAHSLLTVNSKQLTVNGRQLNRVNSVNSVGGNPKKDATKYQKIEEFLKKVPEDTRDLAKAFCYEHGRAPTKKESAYWRKGWNEQAKIGITPRAIQLAYQEMIRDGLTIKSPNSVTAVAETIQRRDISLDSASGSGIEISRGKGREIKTQGEPDE
jgi:hypothetical protein